MKRDENRHYGSTFTFVFRWLWIKIECISGSILGLASCNAKLNNLLIVLRETTRYYHPIYRAQRSVCWLRSSFFAADRASGRLLVGCSFNNNSRSTPDHFFTQPDREPAAKFRTLSSSMNWFMSFLRKQKRCVYWSWVLLCGCTFTLSQTTRSPVFQDANINQLFELVMTCGNGVFLVGAFNGLHMC